MADDLVKVRYGTKAQLPTQKDDNTLYFVTDAKEIYRGSVEYTGNIQNITLAADSSTTNGKRALQITFKDGTTALTGNILNSKAVDSILSILGSTANATVKGLVTLSDAINDTTNDATKGVAATPKSVALAIEAANNYTDEQIAAGFAANDAQVLKGSIAADGTITSTDTTINGQKINAITGYSTGWTFRVTAASTNPLWSSDTSTKVEAGDMVIAIADYGSANQAKDWSIIQSNLIGAVTTDSNTLTADQLVLGNGNQKVKILAAGNNSQVLTIVNGKPAWANLPTEQDTTYTFADGTDGSFTVTPLGGTAQKVYIGKPATAGTADVAEVANKGNISGTATAFGAAAAKGVSTTIANNQNLITAAAVNTWKTSVDTWQGNADDKFDELYDALTWKPFASA